MSDAIKTEQTDPNTVLPPKEKQDPIPAGTEEPALPALDGPDAEGIITAVLFAAGHPLSYTVIGKLFGAAPQQTKARITALSERFNQENRSLLLLALDDCAQLCTREEYAPYIREALGIRRGGNLSNSSIETLAIVAYNQPVTRVYIDSVRGVDSSYAVSSLLERGLITCVGRLDQPGRPMLLGTTPDFLRCFGLSSLEDLPKPEGVGDFPAALMNLTIDDALKESGAAPEGEEGTAPEHAAENSAPEGNAASPRPEGAAADAASPAKREADEAGAPASAAT